MKNGRLEVIPYDENEKLNYENAITEKINDVYEITLNPGLYLLKLSKFGFQTSESKVVCKPGTQ